jgi:osmotically inducible protein OsmC
MALAAELGQAGFMPERIHTKASVTLEKSGGGFAITRIALDTEAHIPDIDERLFQEHADSAKRNCPVSRALAGTTITLNARLI